MEKIKKIKSFILTYKIQIISILSALSGLVVAIGDIGGNVGKVCGIVIAFIAAVIYLIKNGFDNTTISLFTAAIKLILEQIKTANISSDVANSNKELSEDDIKAYLKNALKK